MDKRKPVVMNLDDFSERMMSNPVWDCLNGLKQHYPNFRITMFTVPLDCSREWLEMVKSKYDWIEMALHGSDHLNPREWTCSGSEAVSKLDKLYDPKFFCKGFKAPNWKISKDAFNELRKAGYWVATNGETCFSVKETENNYRYDVGQEVIYCNHYINPEFETWHGHIRFYANPIEDWYEKLLTLWNKDTEFKYISEIVKERQNG